MQFEHAFEVPLAPDPAWALLLDIERIATCIPGAELTEVVDERTYKGKVAVRIGPVALSFLGQATFESIDVEARAARVRAVGTDTKGRGGTTAVFDFSLAPAGEGTRVSIRSDVTLTGAVAQYGRGAGMISSVAGQIIGRFGDCLRERILHAQAGGDPADAAAAKPVSAIPLLARALRDTLQKK
jgi:carbon monoxide dehydrogenase subunit G